MVTEVTTAIASDLLATRKSLIERLKQWDDQESCNAFFNIYWKLIYSAARARGLTDEEAQDVVQETVIGVREAMPGFKYDRKQGPFKAWLLRLTSSRIEDQLRKRSQMESFPTSSDGVATESCFDRSGNSVTIEGAIAADVEQIWDQEWENNLLEAAIERVKQQIDPKQFQLFDLSVLQGWTREKINSVLGIGSAKLFIARHLVAKSIKKELKHMRTQWAWEA